MMRNGGHPKCARHAAFVSSRCFQSMVLADDNCIKQPHEIPPRNIMMMIKSSGWNHRHYLPGCSIIQFDNKMMMVHVRRYCHVGGVLINDDEEEELELCRYIDMGLLCQARTLFDNVPVPLRSKDSWESMIRGYVSYDYMDEARELFNSSPKTGPLWDYMIFGYARWGMLDEAIRIFYKHPEKSPFSWDSMLMGLVVGGNCNEARKFFDYMPFKNETALEFTLLAYLQNGTLDEAMGFLFDNNNDNDNIEAWNLMMAGYKREGMFDEATRIFQRMPIKSSLSWNLMITAHARRRMLDEAKKYFHHIMPVNDTASWNAMIHGYLVNGLVDEARRCFDSIQRKSSSQYGLMIAGYLQSGMLDEARRIFDDAITHNEELDLHYWVLMLVGFVRNGLLDKASQLFDRLFEVENDPRSWDLITRACIKHRFYQEVMVVLEFMREELGISVILDEITMSLVEIGKDYPIEVESGDFIQVMEGETGLIYETFLIGESNWCCCPILDKSIDEGNWSEYKYW